MGEKMIPFRFYFVSLVMILVFLGLGILIGTSLGSVWMEKSYQSIITTLEKKINRISNEKTHLQNELTEAKSVNEDLRKVWLNFYKSHFGDQLKEKNGIVVSKSIDQFPWLKTLKELGLHIKVVSSLKEVDRGERDILILHQPTDEELVELHQRNDSTPELIINHKAIPTGIIDSAYYISLQNENEKDMVSLLEAIYFLLSKRDDY